MKKILLVLMVLLLVSCNSLEKYNQAILNPQSVEALHSDVDKTYIKLKRNHPRLYQYISKEQLDYKFDSLKQTINVSLTSKEFFKKLAPVVKSVGQGHISLSPPQKKRDKTTRKGYKNKHFNFNKLNFDYIESRLFVTRTKDEDSLLMGAEVLEIATIKPQAIVSEYNKYVASDGYNTTLFDAFVGSRFMGYFYKEVGFQDSIPVTFKQRDSVFTKMFRWEGKKKEEATKNDTTKEDTIAKKKFKRLTKEERKAKKLKAKKKRKEEYKYGYNYLTKEYARNFHYIGADSTVAYMKIRGFTAGGYKDFYEDSFKEMDSLKTKNLIIDLRDNGGGAIKEIDLLYSLLTDKEYVFLNESEVTRRLPILNMLMSNTKPTLLKAFAGLFSPIIISHNLLKTKKRDGTLYYRLKGTKPQEPHENNFKGNVYVLINGNSFSASSLLSTHLKATKRATFVGQETGGAYNGTVAGLFKDYELPNSKVRIHMGMLQVETPHKITPDGYGVKPDIEIMPTVSDLENDIDPHIDWVLKDIDTKR